MNNKNYNGNVLRFYFLTIYIYMYVYVYIMQSTKIKCISKVATQSFLVYTDLVYRKTVTHLSAIELPGGNSIKIEVTLHIGIAYH